MSECQKVRCSGLSLSNLPRPDWLNCQPESVHSAFRSTLDLEPDIYPEDVSRRAPTEHYGPHHAHVCIAHLPYLLASPHYEVVALCNSSVESAQAAVKRHSLPSSTKAYGNPENLAQDPDVDLVICCVRVDRHYALMIPSINAGKDVFVEWPLASNLQQAKEMPVAAMKSGSKTIVGLQARPSPFTQKVKELVKSKAIGDLLSSNLSYDIRYPGDVEPPATDYMTKKEVGGNLFTIVFGHTEDSVLYALSGLEEASALLTTR
jgi:predicted dehydrogenase